MSCESPNIFLNLGRKSDGKRIIKMLPKRADMTFDDFAYRYGADNLFFVPCGKCDGCKRSYRRQWSLRCEAEAKLYDHSCFITLTYDNEHNPGVLVKSDLKKFIKAMRNKGIKFRYFGCGEYGMSGSRAFGNQHPHYHIILFGYMPDDLLFVTKSKTGFPIYKSKLIEKTWSKGLCTVQEFDSAVAGYVAGYVDKKKEQKDSFLIMSNRPGIGHDYYIRNLFKLYEHDNFISKNGFVAGLPRYCDKVADQFFMDISDVKEERIKKAKSLNIYAMNVHQLPYIENVFSYAGNIERRRKKYARSL